MNHFDALADEWDDPRRRKRAAITADAIRAAVDLSGRPHTVELGAGTGLLARELADDIGPATLLDNSAHMVRVAQQHIAHLPQWSAQEADLAHPLPGGPYELAISQFALHHIEDVAQLMRYVFDALTPGGVAALADLLHDPAGDYHRDVPNFSGHDGFHPEQIEQWMADAGFDAIQVTDVGVVKRIIDDEVREFPIFLAVGHRPA